MPDTRIIKRYANRKLYDTEHSRYVTLDQISEMIRNGDDVKIVDNKTKEDLTTVTLAQIIFEEEKKQRSFLPLGAMRNIIQSGGQWFAEAQRRVQSILPGKREDGSDEPSAAPAGTHDAPAASRIGRRRSTERSGALSRRSSTRSTRGRASRKTSRLSRIGSPSSKPSSPSSSSTKRSTRKVTSREAREGGAQRRSSAAVDRTLARAALGPHY
jgi:polyhydroxyalkanoate synthesis repressor PhaR